MVPRAAYEDKSYVIDAHLVLTPNGEVDDENELFSEFASSFTSRITGMLHDQVFLEVPKMHTLFTKIT